MKAERISLSGLHALRITWLDAECGALQRADQTCRINLPSWSARMNTPNSSGILTAILPCNDLDASERFYNQLGFARPDSQRPAPGEPDTYRMLSNGKGGYLHLTDAVERC